MNYIYNDERFRVLLDIINNERKAIIFLALGKKPKKICEIKADIEETFPDLLKPILKQNIDSYINKVLAEKNRGIMDEVATDADYDNLPRGLQDYLAREGNGQARAWKLTEFGDFLQPIVAFGMTYLAQEHDISNEAVIGAMNTAYEKRASYARVEILRHLAMHGESSIGILAFVTGLDSKKVQNKVDSLRDVHDHEGNNVPFVRLGRGDPGITKKVYMWTGKELDMSDFHKKDTGLTVLVHAFTLAGTEVYFHAKDLFDLGMYKSKTTLSNAVKTLCSLGYAEGIDAGEFRTVQITEPGRDYVFSCLELMAGALKGTRDLYNQIMHNQPSKEMITHAVNVKGMY